MFPSIDFSEIAEVIQYQPANPMVFSSGYFVYLFLFLVLGYSLVCKHKKARNVYLTLFSIYFYYKSSGVYFLLLLLTTMVDFGLAKWIANEEQQVKRKGLLWLSVFYNLGILLYFKYTNFFIDLTNQGWGTSFHNLDIFLPIGVSFFTFQSMSYTIDVYRRQLEPVDDIMDYAFFVTFFPQIVAGPIVRASDFLPQVSKETVVTKEMFGRGVFLIMVGLFKKIAIADYLAANFVDRVFEAPELYSGLENLFAVYGYALQIYGDFSGYTDMAIGIALLLGFQLPLNFDSPYQSASVTEFWRRWHISLSSWLRDYLYISLGGNRKGKIRTYFNLFMTMFLGGLWHGAALRFVLWGVLHGVALAIERFFKPIIKLPKHTFIHVIKVILTFHFVCFCWIYFRAKDMETAHLLLEQVLFNFNAQIIGEFISGYSNILAMMLVGYLLHATPQAWQDKAQQIFTNIHFVLKILLFVLLVALVVQFKSAEIQPFIYFQF